LIEQLPDNRQSNFGLVAYFDEKGERFLGFLVGCFATVSAQVSTQQACQLRRLPG